MFHQKQPCSKYSLPRKAAFVSLESFDIKGHYQDLEKVMTLKMMLCLRGTP